MKPVCLLLGVIFTWSTTALVPDGLSAVDAPPRVLTRLIFQDDDARTLKWADPLEVRFRGNDGIPTG